MRTRISPPKKTASCRVRTSAKPWCTLHPTGLS
jgi:hypothetical protein